LGDYDLPAGAIVALSSQKIYKKKSTNFMLIFVVVWLTQVAL
jgi:hypothetical protein